MEFVIIPDLLALIASCITSDLIEFACAFLIAPFFGCICSSFSLYGKNFYKTNGKWRTSKGKFIPINQAMLTKALDDPDFERKYRGIGFYTFIPSLIKLAIAVPLFIFSGRARERVFYVRADFGETFFAAYAYIMAFITVMSLILAFVYVFGGKNTLRGYIDEQLGMLRAGMPFSQLELPPLSELPFKNELLSQRILYNTIRGHYLLNEKRINELRATVYELTEQLRPISFILANTLGYYLLIFYYSRYELRPDLAGFFFGKASSALAVDTDSNGRRVLAYYSYGIQRDNAKARFFLEQARAALPNYSSGHGAEYELEKRLIDELDVFLSNEERQS